MYSVFSLHMRNIVIELPKGNKEVEFIPEIGHQRHLKIAPTVF